MGFFAHFLCLKIAQCIFIGFGSFSGIIGVYYSGMGPMERICKKIRHYHFRQRVL